MSHIDPDTSDFAALITATSNAVAADDRICDLTIGNIDLPMGVNAEGCPFLLKEAIQFADERAAAPARRKGTHRIAELASLIAIVNRYKNSDTLVWAEPEAFRVTAVFNEHEISNPILGDGSNAGAGWRDHRAVYDCPRSTQWLAWCANDGKDMYQDAFGDWLEEHLEDVTTGDVGGIAAPAPTQLLKVARDLHVHSVGTFQRTVDPTTGQGTLVCKTEHASNSTPIPRFFLLSMPVFFGGEHYRVEARVRFALINGRATFSYTLHRRKEIEADAFAGVRATIAEQTSLPVYAGVP